MRFRTTVAAIAILLSSACSRSTYVQVGGYAQGGVWAVKANLSGTTTSAKEIQGAIDSILVEIDNTFSGYNKNSMLSRLNRGEQIEPSAMFLDLLAISEDFEAKTGGAFNVKAAPVFDVWGFGFTRDSLPSQEMLSKALEEVKKGSKLNFNAIAQGYTCDVVADYLHKKGVKDMLVDIGEIYCEGLNPKGQGWSIGIDTPFDGNDTPGQSLSGIWRSNGSAQGIVTSGNYRKFYIKDGKKYAHTIDPRTGYPVSHDLLSATVVAPSATEADALATYFMVIGTEAAKDYVNSHEGIEACLISSEGNWTSEGFNL